MPLWRSLGCGPIVWCMVRAPFQRGRSVGCFPLSRGKNSVNGKVSPRWRERGVCVCGGVCVGGGGGGGIYYVSNVLS